MNLKDRLPHSGQDQRENAGLPEEHRYEIKTEELIIRAGEKEIYGRIAYPVTDGKCPAVICSHGYNGTHEWYNPQCDTFARHGIVAYCFDFCGGCTRSRSSGKSTDMTLFTEKQDLLQVIDYISSMDRVDEHAVFLIGGSQGGIVTALAAEERADQLKGIMLYCPAFGIPDNWRGRFGADIPETFEHWGLTLGKAFFTSMKDFSAYDHIGRFKGPVLIFQGDEDSVVPPESSYRAAQKYEQAEVILLKGEGHGISESGVAFAMNRMLRLIDEARKRSAV